VLWDGASPGVKEAVEEYGVDEAEPIGKLSNALRLLAEDRRDVFVTDAEPANGHLHQSIRKQLSGMGAHASGFESTKSNRIDGAPSTATRFRRPAGCSGIAPSAPALVHGRSGQAAGPEVARGTPHDSRGVQTVRQSLRAGQPALNNSGVIDHIIVTPKRTQGEPW